MKTHQFAVWKTIQLGNIKSYLFYQAHLQENGSRSSEWSDDLLLRVKWSKECSTIDLVKTTGREIEVETQNEKWTSIDAIYKKALEVGLHLCTADVGPQLRIQYKGQPKGEDLYMGMDSLKGTNEYPAIFIVSRGQKAKPMSMLDAMCVQSRESLGSHNMAKVLDATYAMEGRAWSIDATWVFAKQKPVG